MASNESIPTVGLGVDIVGGEQSLALLKAINAELSTMTRYASGKSVPGEGSGGSSYGTSAIKQAEANVIQREKVERQSVERVARARADAQQKFSKREIDDLARSKVERNRLDQQIKDRSVHIEQQYQSRIDKIRRDTERKEAESLRRSAANRRSYYAEDSRIARSIEAEKNKASYFQRDRDIKERDARRKLIDSYKMQPGIMSDNMRYQSKVYQGVRTNESRWREGSPNQALRDSHALARMAQRERLNEDRRIAREERIALERSATNRGTYFASDSRIRSEVAEETARARDAAIAAEQARIANRFAGRSSYFQADQRIRNEVLWEASDNAARARSLNNMRAQFAESMSPSMDKLRTKTNKAIEVAQRQLKTADPTLLVRNQELVNSLVSFNQGLATFETKIKGVSTSKEANALAQELMPLRQKLGSLTSDFTKLRSEQLGIEGIRGPSLPRRLRPDGPPGGGGGGPRNIPARLEDPQGLMNEKGFFTSTDVAGRIARNILIYEAVSQASYGLINYVGNAITAAKTTVEFGNALRFATEQADGNVAENLKLADSLLDIGLSRQQGRAAVTEAARFSQDRPQDTASLVGVVSDIAAARGLGIDKTDELIEQLRRRESKFYKRIFGKTVESIYEDEARAYVANQTTSPTKTPNLFIGINPNEIKSTEEQVRSYLSSMDDAQKENAVYNYILSQSSKFQGEAAERANTLAGRLDKVAAAWLNSQEGLGLFITDLKIVNQVLEALAGRVSVLDSLRAPEVGRSGANGRITNADVMTYGMQRGSGFRSDLLNAVDSYAVPGLLAAGGTAALGLLGRGQATKNVRLDNYNKVLKEAVVRMNGDYAAAAQEAINQSKSLRPGLIRSVQTGMQRVTTGVTQGVSNLTGVQLTQTARNVPGIVYGPQGPYTPYIPGATTRSLSQASGLQSGVGVTGGLLGMVAGGVIANFVADKLTTNSIVATGITILGGAAGSALGTAAGDVIGSSIGSYVVKAGGISALLGGGVSSAGAAATGAGVGLAAAIGYALGSVMEPIVSDLFNLPLSQIRKDDRRLAQIEAEQSAYSQQAGQFRDAQATGRLRFRSARPGSSLGLLRPDEVTAEDLRYGVTPEFITERQRRSSSTAATIQRDIATIQSRYGATSTDEALRNISQQRDDLDTELKGILAYNPENTARIQELRTTLSGLQGDIEKLNSLTKEQDTFNAYGTLDPQWIKAVEAYKSDADKREAQRIQKELADREKTIGILDKVLSKLRDAKEGSYRVVGDVATTIAGEDNQYVKVLTEQSTLLDRMQQQWGFLGKASVEYFAGLERAAQNRQLNRLDYAVYRSASETRNRAEIESAQRSGPGLSRRERDYLDIQTAIVDKATQIPELWKQAASVLGQTITPQVELTARLSSLFNSAGIRGPVVRNVFGQDVTPDGAIRNAFGQVVSRYGENQARYNLLGQRMEDPALSGVFGRLGTGVSKEAGMQIRNMMADATLDIFKDYTPEQIRASGYQDLFFGALQQKRQGLDFNIEQARLKAEFGLGEDARLSRQLRDDADFRQRQLALGMDPRNVGRESDALLLARTEGIDPKDLSFEQFRDRQEALRRTAERDEADRQEAKQAVEQGLQMQAAMLENIAAIRAGVLGGDASVVVQVLNDTQAQIDQNALTDLSTGRYNIPLDMGGVRSNPYNFGRNKQAGRYGRRQR